MDRFRSARDHTRISREGRHIADRRTGEILVPDIPGRNESRGRQHLGIFDGFHPQAEALSARHHMRAPYWCPHVATDLWACDRCNFGLQRQDGTQVPVAAPPRIREDEIVWHFRGAVICAGLDSEGHDVVKDVRTGKIERAYSASEKRDALALVSEYGLSATSRKTGVPRTTLDNWKRRGIA